MGGERRLPGIGLVDAAGTAVGVDQEILGAAVTKPSGGPGSGVIGAISSGLPAGFTAGGGALGKGGL